MAPEEARHDRLRPGIVGSRPDRTRDVLGLRDERRHEDHEHRVDLVVGEDRTKRALIGVGVGGRDQVDRVTDAGVR